MRNTATEPPEAEGSASSNGGNPSIPPEIFRPTHRWCATRTSRDERIRGFGEWIRRLLKAYPRIDLTSSALLTLEDVLVLEYEIIFQLQQGDLENLLYLRDYVKIPLSVLERESVQIAAGKRMQSVLAKLAPLLGKIPNFAAMEGETKETVAEAKAEIRDFVEFFRIPRTLMKELIERTSGRPRIRWALAILSFGWSNAVHIFKE